MSNTRWPLVAGNWKMHGSRAENSALLEAMTGQLDKLQAEVLVCPPFVYLAEIAGRCVPKVSALLLARFPPLC